MDVACALNCRRSTRTLGCFHCTVFVLRRPAMATAKGRIFLVLLWLTTSRARSMSRQPSRTLPLPKPTGL